MTPERTRAWRGWPRSLPGICLTLWAGLACAQAQDARTGAERKVSEIAIPFKTLNFDPDNPDWGFTVGRVIPRRNEKIAWTSYDREINPAVDWRPSSRWYFSTGYQYTEVDLPAGSFTTRLIQFRANLAFNAEWS